MVSEIKNTILVASGKGGVGKSTVATNVAVEMARRGLRVGLLDADIYGPSIPTMLGAVDRPTTDGKRIKPAQKYGLKLMSIGYLVDPNVAMIWRGPMLAGAVQQFVNDVDWGTLDYLIFDLPPGTGDIQLTLAQQLTVTGSVLVTTPQTVALADVTRAKAMFDKVQINTLGLIENMSYFVCSQCDTRHEIFAHGGGEAAAREQGVTFLGRVPIETSVRVAGDEGEPIVLRDPESSSARAFAEITDRLVSEVDRLNEEKESEERRASSLRIVSS